MRSARRSVTEVDEVCQALRHSGMRLARVPKDRFANPTAVGYRDLMMNVTMPNGIVGELQIHVKAMLDAKAVGHTPYETMRSIEAKYRQSDPMREAPESSWAPADQQAWQRAFQESRAIYGAAWLKAQGARTARRAAMQGYEYFEYDGAYFRKPAGAPGGPGEIWHAGERRWVAYRGDPTRILHFGNPVRPADRAEETD